MRQPAKFVDRLLKFFADLTQQLSDLLVFAALGSQRELDPYPGEPLLGPERGEARTVLDVHDTAPACRVEVRCADAVVRV